MAQPEAWSRKSLRQESLAEEEVKQTNTETSDWNPAGSQSRPVAEGGPTASVATDEVVSGIADRWDDQSEAQRSSGESEQHTVLKKRGKRPERPREGKGLPGHRTVGGNDQGGNQAPERSQRESNG